MKGVPYVPDVTGKLDGRPPCPYFDCLKALASQPVGHCLNIRVGRAKLFSKLVRRQPFMKIGRVLAQLLVHEFAERGLLFRAALQDEHHPFHRRGVSDDAPIEFGAGEGMDVALQADELRFVDGLGDARGDGGLRGGGAIRRGLRGDAKRGQRQDQSKNEKEIAKHRGLKFHNTPTVQN